MTDVQFVELFDELTPQMQIVFDCQQGLVA
jgi:hypothetical protein